MLGAWVNPEYDGRIDPARVKTVFKEDGAIVRYNFSRSGNTINVHCIIDVKENWMDRKGVVYFKALVDKRLSSTMNVFMKIDSDRKTIEILEASKMEILPAEMNPKAE